MRRSHSVPEGQGQSANFCSRCGAAVTVGGAKFCKQCGAPLGGPAWLRRDISWRPTLAAALSIVPGLGHLYKRRPWQALGWFFGVIAAYGVAQSLGLLLQLICAGNAALSGAIKEEAFFPSGHGDRRPAGNAAGHGQYDA